VKKERENIGFQEEKGYIHNEAVSKDVAKTYSITGSPDIDDVNWLMPFSMLLTAAWPIGVNAHTWQSASASVNRLGKKGMLYCSKIMAGVQIKG